MKIGENYSGKNIELSLIDEITLGKKFGLEELRAFIEFANDSIRQEHADPDFMPKILDYKFINNIVCIILRVVTEYGCFNFIAAPYSIYSGIYPKPENPNQQYHYSSYYMPHELVRMFNKWIDRIEGPLLFQLKDNSK
ncbi:hypothetical protein [Paenibacillus sp. MMO-58]|uniref:hypothetical protein n=1 Tax=Paenibacillus sp. MMO-58 TaxID=3081290 RepID=UPI00301900F5